MISENPDELQDSQLIELTDKLIERLRDGKSIDEEALLQQYPRYRTQLQDMMATIQLVADLGKHEPRDDASADADRSAQPQKPLGMLGDFRLLREIGRGGMGVVYEAEQLSLSRHIALKVLPFASVFDARQLSRFKNEAQAAASLNHPHIVPVYGVGCERGVHYYAMQLVSGQSLADVIGELQRLRGETGEAPQSPISQLTEDLSSGRFAPEADTDDDRISPRPQQEASPPVDTDRVSAAAVATDQSTLSSPEFFRTIANLGRQAAEALQHAHDHGIVHRDIKPGNLMLDEAVHLWITDFGLAHIESAASVTISGDVVGTLRYMSPEQARVQPGVVDQRSDVYSLGITLYELLTQRPAFGGKTRQELLNQISGQEPRRPTAHNRSIPRDLETIVLKASRKLPSERYASAAELAEDLKRFLNCQPIQAKPPTWSERTFKWAQRNRGVVATVAIGMLVGLVGMSISSALIWKKEQQTQGALAQVKTERTAALQSKAEADRARKEAEQVKEFLIEAFRSPDPEQDGRTITVAQLLDQAVEQLDTRFVDQPQVKASILSAIGDTYVGLGLYEDAFKVRKRTIQICQQALGPTHATTLTAKRNLAHGHLHLDHFDKAKELAVKVRNDSLRILGIEHPDTLASMYVLALALDFQGDYGEAEELFKQVVEKQQRILGEEHSATLTSMDGLAVALANQGKYGDAEKLHRKILQIERRTRDPEHPSVLLGMHNLAADLLRQAKYDEAGELILEVREIWERTVGPEHPKTLASMVNLAALLSHQGKYGEAAELFRTVLEIRNRTLGPERPTTLTTLNNLAVALSKQGKHGEAIECHEQALQVQKRTLGLEHPDTLRCMANLAAVLQEQTKYRRAEELNTEVLEIQRRGLGPDHPGTLNTMNNLANVMYLQGRYAEAEELHRTVLESARRVLGEEHPRTFSSMLCLASTIIKQGRHEEAEKLMHNVLEIQQRVLGADHPHTLYSMSILADLYSRQGKRGEAERLLRDVLEIHRRERGAEHHETFTAMAALAHCLSSQGKHTEAESLHTTALEARRRTLGPAHGHTLASMGFLAASYLAQGKDGDAERQFREAAEIAGRTLGAENEQTLAITDSLAHVISQQGQCDEAERMYREITGTAGQAWGPEHPITLQRMSSLAWFLATCPQPSLRKPEEAVRLALADTQRTATNARSWRILGAAQYRLGDCQAAIRSLEKSAQLRGSMDARLLYFLAMAHKQLGNDADSDNLYDRAVNWMDTRQPHNSELKRFRTEAAELLGQLLDEEPKDTKQSLDGNRPHSANESK